MPRTTTGYDLMGRTITSYHFGLISITGCDTPPSTTSGSFGGMKIVVAANSLPKIVSNIAFRRKLSSMSEPLLYAFYVDGKLPTKQNQGRGGSLGPSTL
jgi:hypothetical protein